MNKFAVMCAVLGLALVGSAPAEAVIFGGSWDDMTSDLQLGTWFEVYAGGPGQPGCELSAQANDGMQWMLGGIFIVEPPEAQDNGDGTITYTTDYYNVDDPGASYLTLGEAPTLWCAGAQFTNLLITVAATIDMNTGEYLGGEFWGCADGVDGAAGKTIFMGGTLDETAETPEGHEGTVDTLTVTIEPLTVPLDIKPGSCPNPLNRGSRGKLPVAILGTAGFDVSMIDVATIALSRADGIGGTVAPLQGPPGPGIHMEDVGTPFCGEACECHEMEGDGICDLTMKFSTPEVVQMLELADVEPGTLELVVSGSLLDGTPFSASDCVLLRVHGQGQMKGAGGQPR